MDIQVEKLKLIEWLASLTDQSLIEQLKLFKENFLLKMIGGKLCLTMQKNPLMKVLRML
jgi:hypothetical protein